MAFKFYYDETEHSRKINLKTLKADNFYDNFVTVIIGWDDALNDEIEKKYLTFEDKYNDRKSHGELKSTTLSQKQFMNGFASMSLDNAELISDFLSVFDEHVFWCFSVQSKVEFIIHQLFANYRNSLMLDADAVKYTIIKAINTYKPERVMECIYGNHDQLVPELRKFLEERIEKNKENTQLKESESRAFEQLLMILSDSLPLNTEDWDYHIPFDGFSKYLREQKIADYRLIIDREGNEQKTLKAALEMGHRDAGEGDSKSYVGLRMADMLVGILSKFMKAMNKALQSDYHSVEKVVLEGKWFRLDERQKKLYRRLHYVISDLNDSWNKSYAGIFTDDLISFIALLKYIDEQPVERLDGDNSLSEEFNTFCIECLQGRFEEMRHKLSKEIITLDAEGCFINRWGAKVYSDATNQPGLIIEGGSRECFVVNAGFDRRGIPTVTIREDGDYRCYRIPGELSEWAINLVAFKNMGQEVLPAKVRFTKRGSKWNADII